MRIYIRNLQRTVKIDRAKIEKSLDRTLCNLDLGRAELSVLFVNDSRMKGLNRRFRSVDSTTDVLSFPLEENIGQGFEGELGDIVISGPRAERQAAEYGASVHDEIMRLLIHGLLHLLGYDHETGPQERKRMKKKEKELLHAIKKMD